MDSRYSIIISCLKLLKASSWSTTKKLRAEIKFIKIKRHLLNEDSEASMTGSCGEAVFNALLYQISSIKEAGWERDAHPLLLHSLEEILSALTMDEGEPASSYDSISGQIDTTALLPLLREESKDTLT